jgi:TetR/AcrR family transcriptional repressor of nem operon
LQGEERLGRPRSFDDDKALDAAALCFWARGYEATSVRDLSLTMGIAAPSLYNAYGDKRMLFIASLQYYCEKACARLARFEAAEPGTAAIAGFFSDIVERSLSDPDRKGCFLVNAALEVAPHDAAVQTLIAAYFKGLQAFFQKNIEAAKPEGGAASVDPVPYSAHLLSVVMGIRVLARWNPERNVLEAAASHALLPLRSNPTSEDRA